MWSRYSCDRHSCRLYERARGGGQNRTFILFFFVRDMYFRPRVAICFGGSRLEPQRLCHSPTNSERFISNTVGPALKGIIAWCYGIIIWVSKGVSVFPAVSQIPAPNQHYPTYPPLYCVYTWYCFMYIYTYIYIYIYIYMGCVGVGWRRRSETRLSLRELENQGTDYFWRSPRLAVEIDHFCAGKILTPHKGDERLT